MNNAIKKFIEENKDLIENNEWEEIYVKTFFSLELDEIGDFTSLLLNADINPLEYLNYIPGAFLCNQDISSFKIPDHIKSIGHYAFLRCANLTNIAIPDRVMSIGGGAFEDCTSLKSITIPDSVTSIGVYEFYNCTSLTRVIIPDSVTNIGASAFANCTSLTSVTYNGTKAQWQAINKGYKWNHKVPSTCKINCTDGDLNI